MNSPSEINSPSKNRSTTNIINNIHTMSWLKKDFSSLENSKTRYQTVTKDGEILSQKKTDEVYFPGTRREDKRMKKKKDKKSSKSGVVIANLQDLVSLTQQNEKKSTSVQDANGVLIDDQTVVEKEPEIIYGMNKTTTNGTVWSNTSDTADKLFPNVQSVRIDRREEEEMLSRAIAESIATVQLEQFNRPSPDKENRWEALYGDFEDEGSWDNVKRNLPTEPEPANSGDASGQKKSRDDNNNSSKSGILRNRQTGVNRHLIAAQEHDFCFKTPSESSKDELEKAQALKSVSFNESVAVKIRSSESSESDKSDKIINENKRGPNIDKYGRVDGYSERRLFMGKGARIREQEYIQNQCSTGIKNLDLESHPKATVITKTQEPDLENPMCEKTIARNNFQKKPEIKLQQSESSPQLTAIVRTQEPASKSIPNFKNHNKTKKAIAVKNIHRTQRTSRAGQRDERDERNVKRPNESVEKSPGNRPALDIALNTTDLVSSSNQKLDFHEEKQKAVNAAEVESGSYEISSLSQRGEIPEIKDAQDLGGEVLNKDMILKNFTTVVETEDDSDSGGPCLVPTLVRQDGYTPNLFPSNFQYTESIPAMSEAEPQSPACQNLILAGVSCEDAKRDVQSFTPRYSDPTNLQYQNYSILDPVSSLQSQGECGNQIYQNPPINHDAYTTLLNYAKMNETDSDHFMHRLSAGNFPYQNVGLGADPEHQSIPNFTERGETGLPNINTEHLKPITDLRKAPPHEGTDNDKRLFSTARAPPGFINNLRLPSGLIRNLQLPSGFRKRESTQSCDTEVKNFPVTQKVESNDRESLGQNRPGYHDINWRPVQASSKPTKKHENFNKPQIANSDQEKSPVTENRKVPYPILGANQHSDEKNSDLKRVESKTSQSSELRREAVNNGSPNTRENCRRPSPNNNNNYLFRSTQSTNSDFNRQEMDDTPQNSQSGVPLMCQMADRLSPGSSDVSNWQYNVNIMNPPQVPMNLSTYHQMQTLNPHDMPANISPDYFHGFHQLPMHAYPMRHLMNTGVTDARNMSFENIGSPDMDSALNGDSLMQESISGDNYSLDETPVGQFLPDYNFHDHAWNVRNNQTDNSGGKIFDNFNVGRGRGRLERKNDF